MVSVFIVEGDLSLRLLYKKALTISGYDVIGLAKDGDEAIKMYENFLKKT